MAVSAHDFPAIDVGDVPPQLERYVPVGQFIQEILGADSEVVLHDTSQLDSSIVAIFNPSLSGRRTGGPATDLALKILRNPELVERGVLTNYHAQLASRQLRSHTLVLRDVNGAVIGLLCVNTDITKALQAKDLLTAWCATTPLTEDSKPESFRQSAAEVAEEMLLTRVVETGIDPVLMTPSQRKTVVKLLEEDGFFDLRSSINKAAEVFNVSKATIYRYISDDA